MCFLCQSKLTSMEETKAPIAYLKKPNKKPFTSSCCPSNFVLHLSGEGFHSSPCQVVPFTYLCLPPSSDLAKKCPPLPPGPPPTSYSGPTKHSCCCFCAPFPSFPYPLGELSIHHEVVHVLLRARQLQFPRDDGHQESRATRSLKEGEKRH